jgi:Ca-activated chloride channel family protein
MKEVVMRLLASVLVICLLGLVQASPVRLSGAVVGSVVDAQGAPLPGATVELRAGTRVERTGLTNERGEFRFEGVPPGSYTLRAALAGFQAASVRIQVGEGTPKPTRLVLQSGPVTEQVTVAAAAPVSPSRQEFAYEMAAPAAPTAALPDSIRRRRGPFNTEAYAHLEENPFLRVGDEPLSTFSIDVDTASYANVRRFLTRGTLPPADAVRIEELVNYFRFSYADAPKGQPFSVTTEIAPCPWNPRHRLALIGLQAPRIESGRTPPRNLVFLLDVSGSMQDPDKLPLVKTAMRMLTDTLTEADRVAIVVYAGASGLALPSTQGDRKEPIQQAIAALEAGGSTNGASGINLAYDVAEKSFVKGGINRVILATDGDFNVGVTSEGELVRLIERQRERGIFLSVLGVGTGNLKDSTMEKLANRGNGNYAYLDSLHEARRVLIAEAGATLVTVAKDVKIQVEFNPQAVGAYRLIGYENRLLANQDFNDDRKDAGEIGAGHTVTALYELVPPGEPIDGSTVDPLRYQSPTRPNAAARSGELMTVKLRYKQPDGDTSQLMSAAARDGGASASPNLGFASAVAEFGLLLRKSPFKGKASWESVLARARQHRGVDSDGYRSEFIRLVELAAALEERTETSPQVRR